MRILRLCCVIMFTILSVSMVAGAPRTAPAAATCPPEGCKVFTPVAVYDILPQLVYPVGETTLNTLAPTLLWSPVVPGSYRVQVTDDQTFSEFADYVVDQNKDLKVLTGEPVGTLVTSNLKGATAYYWRVSMTTTSGVLNSQAGSFITPLASSGVLPGDVTVLEPKNNAGLRRDSVLLKWNPVPGALLYRIRMTDSTGKTFSPGSAYVDGSEINFWVYELKKGETYTWKIKAYNAFGWGSYTVDMTFRII